MAVRCCALARRWSQRWNACRRGGQERGGGGQERRGCGRPGGEEATSHLARMTATCMTDCPLLFSRARSSLVKAPVLKSSSHTSARSYHAASCRRLWAEEWIFCLRSTTRLPSLFLRPRSISTAAMLSQRMACAIGRAPSRLPKGAGKQGWSAGDLVGQFEPLRGYSSCSTYAPFLIKCSRMTILSPSQRAAWCTAVDPNLSTILRSEFFRPQSLIAVTFLSWISFRKASSCSALSCSFAVGLSNTVERVEGMGAML